MRFHRGSLNYGQLSFQSRLFAPWGTTYTLGFSLSRPPLPITIAIGLEVAEGGFSGLLGGFFLVAPRDTFCRRRAASERLCNCPVLTESDSGNELGDDGALGSRSYVPNRSGRRGAFREMGMLEHARSPSTTRRHAPFQNHRDPMHFRRAGGIGTSEQRAASEHRRRPEPGQPACR